MPLSFHSLSLLSLAVTLIGGDGVGSSSSISLHDAVVHSSIQHCTIYSYWLDWFLSSAVYRCVYGFCVCVFLTFWWLRHVISYFLWRSLAPFDSVVCAALVRFEQARRASNMRLTFGLVDCGRLAGVSVGKADGVPVLILLALSMPVGVVLGVPTH